MRLCVLSNRLLAYTLFLVPLRETIWRVLNLPPTTVMEYKSNNGTPTRSLYLSSTHKLLQTPCKTSRASGYLPA